MNSTAASAGLGPSPSPPHSHASGPLTTKRVTILSNEVGKRLARAYTRVSWDRCRDPSRPRGERVQSFLAVVFCTFQFPKVSRLGRIIEWVLIITILTNTANLIMATYPAGQYQPMACPDPICVPPKCPQVVCAPTERWAVLYVNVGIVLIFTIDYVARLVSVHGTEARVVHACDLAIDLEGNAIDMRAVLGSNGWRKTRDFFFSVMGMIDLFSILPFYINLFAFKPLMSLQTSDPGLKEVMHLSRALRLFKLLRHSKQTVLFTRTLQASLPALRFFIIMSLILYLGIAGIIFFLERGEFQITDDRPLGAFYRTVPNSNGTQEVSPFTDLMEAFRWVIINTSTLKETMPVYNPVSQIISVPLSYASVVLLALPISIIGRFFQRQYDMLMATVEVPRSLRQQATMYHGSGGFEDDSLRKA